MSEALRTQINCPVTLLAVEFNALVKAFNAADRKNSAGGGCPLDRPIAILYDRMEAITEQVSWLDPQSHVGAAFQIMQANTLLGFMPADESVEQDRIERRMARLLYRAEAYLSQGDMTLHDAREYGARDDLDPQATIADALDGKAVRP